jgi:hypothetical protein
MDNDLRKMSREQLQQEVMKLRRATQQPLELPKGKAPGIINGLFRILKNELTNTKGRDSGTSKSGNQETPRQDSGTDR